MVVETNENNNLYSGSPIEITVGGTAIPLTAPLQTGEMQQSVGNGGRSPVAP